MVDGCAGFDHSKKELENFSDCEDREVVRLEWNWISADRRNSLRLGTVIEKSCLVVACLLLTGCAARRVRPNYSVPVSAVSRVTLIHCDPQTKPLVCERISVSYRDGAELLLAAGLP